MITDYEWILSDDQSPVTDPSITPLVVDLTTGNSFSANVHKQVLDTGNLGIVDFGAGDGSVYLFWRVSTALAGAGASLNVQLVSSASPTLSTPNIHRETGVGTFNGGLFDVTDVYKWRLDVGQTWLQHIGMRFVISGADLTAGKFTAALVNHVDAWRATASGMKFGF